MVGNLFVRAASDDDVEKPQPENVNWLPRSRLRAGGRGDFLLTALMVATLSVLAAAAGFAAWSRHGGEEASTTIVSEKAPERATVARAPAVPAASSPTPVRNVSAIAAAPAALPSDVRAPAPAPTALPAPAALPATAAPAATIRIDSSGAPVNPTVRSTQIARMEPPAEIVPPSDSPQTPVAPAPLPRFSAGNFEAPAPLAGVSDWAPPAAPSAPARSGPPARSDLTRAAPPPERAPLASSPAPAPQRTAALTPPPAAGAKVSVYLDAYPDQKAAAAALSQKSGAYGKAIGSGGKLTYTRRKGDSWRLRVSNLEQSAAVAMCVRLKSAGAPCSIGPN